MWSVRTLSRNISTQYYERHFHQPVLPAEKSDAKIPAKEEILKSPLIAEFLGFKADEPCNVGSHGKGGAEAFEGVEAKALGLVLDKDAAEAVLARQIL